MTAQNPVARKAPLSENIHHLPPQSVVIPEGRQRTGGASLDTSDLEPSVRERGIYNPLIVKRANMELVAGERRLRTALKLKLATIPIRFYEELDELECRIIELEENERRSALDWKDHARAIAELHAAYGAKAAEGWSIVKTAEMLFYDQGHLSKCLRVARDIANPRIANAPGLGAAYNILVRQDERRIGDAMSEITLAGIELEVPAQAQDEVKAEGSVENFLEKAIPKAAAPLIVDARQSILVESFLTWAPAYRGPAFSFVHCDFPYGTNLFKGPQSGRDKWDGGYDDNPDVYWSLIRCFCKHRDRFLAQSAHLMFWFDMEQYEDTLQLFAELAPELAFHKKPLIWSKSDNVGILPDPKRGPRHIYETCFIASRGDRLVVAATSDAYSCPTDKALHPSTKPAPMLRYFMRMFVDEFTNLLDPTCGSGAALRAAESLGARSVLGLEINPEFAEAAQIELRKDRLKAYGAKKPAMAEVKK